MSKKAIQKTFDWTKSRARKVAFRLSYLGENFHGFTGLPEDAAPTIEGCLFKALLTSKLIPNYQECDWSRAGRTDKGVSGYGQVVSLWIRSRSSLQLVIKNNYRFKVAVSDYLFRLEEPLLLWGLQNKQVSCYYAEGIENQTNIPMYECG